MIIWMIGLSGAGKTAIGREVYNKMKTNNPATVLIDGDEIRDIFKHDKTDQDYNVDGRKKNAERIKAMCLWLDKQGIDVVCCILSIFEENHQWNREHYSDYFEVFVDAPFEDLVDRNPKNLYRQAQEGKIKDVVGVNIPFTPPQAPDMIIHNPRPFKNASLVADEILTKIHTRK